MKKQCNQLGTGLFGKISSKMGPSPIGILKNITVFSCYFTFFIVLYNKWKIGTKYSNKIGRGNWTHEKSNRNYLYIFICFWFGEMLYWVQEIIFFVIIVNGRSVIDGAADWYGTDDRVGGRQGQIWWMCKKTPDL